MRRLSRFFRWQKTFQPSATKRTEDYCAHMYLGNMYAALGHTARAEAEYALAHALSPSEETTKQLTAIRRQGLERQHSNVKTVLARYAA